MNKIRTFDFHLGTIAASGSATSPAIDLGGCQNVSRFSVQYIITATGAPEFKIEYLSSNDGINYVSPGALAEIVTGKVKGDTPSLPTSFTPPLCRWLKLIATETGTSDSGVVRLIVAVQ